MSASSDTCWLEMGSPLEGTPRRDRLQVASRGSLAAEAALWALNGTGRAGGVLWLPTADFALSMRRRELDLQAAPVELYIEPCSQPRRV